MPTPEPAHRPAGPRRPVAQARVHGAEVLALRYAQAGLRLLPEQAAYLTAHLCSPSDLSLPRRQLAAARDEDAEQGDYFFFLDDNIMHLCTAKPLFAINTHWGQEVKREVCSVNCPVMGRGFAG